MPKVIAGYIQHSWEQDNPQRHTVDGTGTFAIKDDLKRLGLKQNSYRQWVGETPDLLSLLVDNPNIIVSPNQHWNTPTYYDLLVDPDPEITFTQPNVYQTLAANDIRSPDALENYAWVTINTFPEIGHSQLCVIPHNPLSISVGTIGRPKTKGAVINGVGYYFRYTFEYDSEVLERWKVCAGADINRVPDVWKGPKVTHTASQLSQHLCARVAASFLTQHSKQMGYTLQIAVQNKIADLASKLKRLDDEREQMITDLTAHRWQYIKATGEAQNGHLSRNV